MKRRIIFVECRCGQILFKYEKIGEGRLIKCYLSRILSDTVGIPEGVVIGTDVRCPKCRERVGTIYSIRGVRAVKLNQGHIKPFRL